jgi:hypothetical protein
VGDVASAYSCRLVGNRKVRFMGAAEVGTDPVSDRLGREQAGRLDDGALAMYPLGVDGVEPGALDGHSPLASITEMGHSSPG